jgi:FG-GAP-like repeat
MNPTIATTSLLVTVLGGGCVSQGDLFSSREGRGDLDLRAVAVLEGDDSFGSRIVNLGDINGDGKDDVAFSSSNGEVHVRYGQPLPSGRKTFTPDVVLGGGGGVAVAAGDLDGDKLADFLVVAGYSGSGKADTYVVYGDRQKLRSGTLAERADAILTGSQTVGATIPAPAALGDIDGDGKADLLFTQVDGQHQVSSELLYGRRWTGTSARTADAVLHTRDGYGGAHYPIGDFDGDGYRDFVFAEYEWYAPRGAASFTTFVVWGGANRLTGSLSWAAQKVFLRGLHTGYGQEVTALGDLDGDGKDDIAILPRVDSHRLIYGGARLDSVDVTTLNGPTIAETQTPVPSNYPDSGSEGAYYSIYPPVPVHLTKGEPASLVFRTVQHSPQGIYVVPAGTRLTGNTALENLPVYSGGTRVFDPPKACDECYDQEPYEGPVGIGIAADITEADQDGDGDHELYLGAVPGQFMPGWVIVVE